jgi:hypothetical protein
MAGQTIACAIGVSLRAQRSNHSLSEGLLRRSAPRNDRAWRVFQTPLDMQVNHVESGLSECARKAIFVWVERLCIAAREVNKM